MLEVLGSKPRTCKISCMPVIPARKGWRKVNMGRSRLFKLLGEASKGYKRPHVNQKQTGCKGHSLGKCLGTR